MIWLAYLILALETMTGMYRMIKLEVSPGLTVFGIVARCAEIGGLLWAGHVLFRAWRVS